jgi:hypothetical protein
MWSACASSARPEGAPLDLTASQTVAAGRQPAATEAESDRTTDTRTIAIAPLVIAVAIVVILFVL